MKYSILILIYFLPISTYSQTCIITVKTENEIIVAADSKQQTDSIKIINNEPVRSTSSRKMRKIIQCGKKYYSMSGWFSGEFEQIIYGIYRKEGIISDAVDSIVKKMYPLMKTAMSDYMIRDPIGYKDRFKTGVVTMIAFYGFENHIPILEFVIFKMSLSLDPGSLTYDFLHAIPCNNSIEFLIMGHVDAFDAMTNDYLCDLISKSKNKSLLLKQLIEKQILKTPDDVGKPIDAIQITDKGVKWSKWE